MENKTQTTGVRPVKSAVHTIEILEYLAARSDEPVRLRSMVEDLGIPRSSLYALLRTLAELGWIRRDSTGTLYSIGIRALMAGTTFIDSDPYLRAAMPILEDINEKLDETVHYGRLDARDIVYLATKESSQYQRYVNRVGRRLPASVTALGKAILADRIDNLEGHVFSPLPQLTESSITDIDELRKELQETRDRGYAIDYQENSLGIRCFGVVLHTVFPATDAISCSVPLNRLTETREQEIVETLQNAVNEIERHLPRPSQGRAV